MMITSAPNVRERVLDRLQRVGVPHLACGREAELLERGHAAAQALLRRGACLVLVGGPVPELRVQRR